MNLPAFSKTYAGKTVLSLPELSLQEGKIHGVIGTNGCGKSTMARILAGEFPADQGPVLPKSLRVGYMPQKSYPFHMTVLRNLLLTGGEQQAALELLEKFGLSHLAHRNARTLSGGETARMAIARLLMREYDLLILDEPTAAMDISATLLAEEILQAYQQRTGCTVLLVTHSLTQARRLAHRLLFLQEGLLVEQGETEQVLDHPTRPETAAFLEFTRL